MLRTVNVHGDIPADRELRITLPAEIPVGRAEIVVVVASDAEPGTRTLGDLGNSEFFGMWRGRADIVDSVQWARELRDRWNR